jgi:predicted transcriptional regulator
MPENDQPSQPSWSELDILAAVWEAASEGGVPVRLSEIHKRVINRRAAKNEPEPAITTVSTQLRSLVAKRLLEEVKIIGPSGEVGAAARSMTRPPSRSPLTGYRPVHGPGTILEQTFKDLASAYPDQIRYQALLDFARALELPKGTLKKIEKLLKEEKLITER